MDSENIKLLEDDNPSGRIISFPVVCEISLCQTFFCFLSFPLSQTPRYANSDMDNKVCYL